MPLLELSSVYAGYGPITVLHGISLTVDQGEIVTLIGANGAGKSTTLRAISRLLPVSNGAIRYEGQDLSGLSPDAVAAMGISHVPEGRGVFGNLTVTENLTLATFAARGRDKLSVRLKAAFDLFPVLFDRRQQLASTLSGGEQQMLAIGRAVVADGDLLIFDEPSMGLAPIYVKNVFGIIAGLRARGKTVLLVEQNATMALKISDRAYVLENGKITMQGAGSELMKDTALTRAYLG